MMKKKRGTHSNMSLVAIVFMATFFLLAGGLLSLAAGRVYQVIDRRGVDHDIQRIVFGYLTNQVRRADREDCISVISFGDGDALMMTEWEEYATVIYCHDGKLMELFADMSFDAEPSMGAEIAAVERLELNMAEQLIATVHLADGESVDVLLPVRGEVGS